MKELAQSDDSPRPSALAQPAPEADALKPAQPKLEAEQADRVVDSAAEAESAAPADEAKLADLQSANARKLGFARRLSLQDSKAQGNMAARNENRAIESPAAAATGVASQPTREAATAAADSLEEVQGGPQADAALADSAVEGAPAAPPSSPVATLANDGRDNLKKSKEQDLVRVLFVLRAVSPAPVTEAEAAPAEAAGEPQQ